MRIHDFFSQFFKPVPDQSSDDALPELEQLTNKLIADAKINLQGVFNQQMAKRTKPLGTEDAKMVLEVLIKAAIAKRELLIGRLEKDLEEGNLYRRYLQKIEIINDLTSDSHIKAKVMMAMEDDYITKYKILKSITMPIYKDGVNNEDLSDRDNTGIAVDLNEEMQLQKLSVISKDILRKTYLDQLSLEWEEEESDDSMITASSADQGFDASVRGGDSKAFTDPNGGGQGDSKQDNSEESGANSVQNDRESTDDGGKPIG